MITKEVNKKNLAEWKRLSERYIGKLSPNRKTGQEVAEYLRKNYRLTPIEGSAAGEIIAYNIMNNAHFREKLPENVEPEPISFYVENEGKGRALYKGRNKKNKIFVGLDLATGYFTVEGSERLWNELFLFRGLDERDLKNYVIIAQYIMLGGK